MAKLIYGSNMSPDGWTEDANGGFDWAPPDDDVVDPRHPTVAHRPGEPDEATFLVPRADANRGRREDLAVDLAGRGPIRAVEEVEGWLTRRSLGDVGASRPSRPSCVRGRVLPPLGWARAPVAQLDRARAF